MTLAAQLIPAVSIPERARRPVEVPRRLATVTVLHAPGDAEAPVASRLTRRGVVVLTLAVLALGVALVWVARLSAPQPATGGHAPRSVTVVPGDTLWSIATRVAPQADPRAEVAALQQRNHLTTVDLMPGQVLRVP